MLKTFKPFCLLLLSCFFCVLAFGCSKAPLLSGLSPLKGKITLDGAPLEGATVSFVPFESANRPATAKSDANGEFKVRTLEPDDGIAPGKYNISVSKRVTESGKEMTPEEAFEASQKGKQVIINRIETLPAKYTKAISSGFEVTVIEGKNEDIILDLTSK